jgi:hypothetical protein
MYKNKKNKKCQNKYEKSNNCGLATLLKKGNMLGSVARPQLFGFSYLFGLTFCFVFISAYLPG